MTPNKAYFPSIKENYYVKQDTKHKAAVTIQKSARGFNARRKIEAIKNNNQHKFTQRIGAAAIGLLAGPVGAVAAYAIMAHLQNK